MPSLEKDLEELKENKVESTDIFSEHNVSQIKDRKYRNFYLNSSFRAASKWRASASRD